ncbi:MAG: tyrosine-type recombinase/integrase [Myxococcota bacterium]
MLVYSAGLRVGEVVKLRSEDIDDKRMLIHIKDVKGRKDRYTLLSEREL